ncbi:hypothetical protein Patl1_04712 [Pistacia atlantica]|uniref:Uncharacterized protein n=1 Tax=Pistacia atlantica TaxID=434234 RepID=A0ACC1BUN2_9ROSI|nr:hypothetical protein Patl1_04712 [Pistacia atlantica]
MAAILFLAKRVSKTSPRDFPNCFQSATRFLSTAYERAEGSNAVAETTRTSNDPIGQGMYEAKQEALDVDEGRASGPTGFVADTAKKGVKKAVDMAENVGNTAKKTIDGAWKAAREGAESVKKTVGADDDDYNIHEDPAVLEVHKIDDPIDTQEYRSIEEVNKAGGYDKVHYG